MARRDGTWPGGYIRRDAKGRAIYVLRRSMGGQRYEVSTECSTLRAAMKELERFEGDPAGYRSGGTSAGAIYLDEDLSARFLAAHAKNSVRWQRQQQLFLAWWAGQLRGVDLRHATLHRHILPAVDGTTSAPRRKIIIKRLYSWMREKDMISAAEDPCLGKLKVERGVPAQLDRSKVIPVASYEAARLHLDGHLRDALDLLAGTGWHVTEAVRFAEGGTIEKHGDATVLMVRHKSGAPHRTLVSDEVAAAARRLRAHGELSDSQLGKALKEAVEKAGVEPFFPSWFRHTVATMATDAGQEALVPGFLGHRSADTTRRFYAVRVTPPKVKTLR